MELTADINQAIGTAIDLVLWCSVCFSLAHFWHIAIKDFVEGWGRTLGKAISETSPKNIEAKQIEQEIESMKLALLKVSAGKK